MVPRVDSFDGPTLLHKIEKKWKLNVCLRCLNHFVQYVF